MFFAKGGYNFRSHCNTRLIPVRARVCEWACTCTCVHACIYSESVLSFYTMSLFPTFCQSWSMRLQ